MMDLKLNKIRTDQVLHASFFCNDGWDNIIITYSKTLNRGFITITSSYGNWSNWWGAMGKDTDIPKFFQQADKYYLANKLWDHSANSKTFDVSDAKDDLKKEVIKDRQQNNIDKEQARILFNEIDEIDSECGPEGFYHNLSDEVWSWYPDWMFMNPGYRTSSKYKALRDKIIPLIKQYFAGELKEYVE